MQNAILNPYNVNDKKQPREHSIMFGFSEQDKQKKAAKKISHELRRQIDAAMKTGGEAAGARVASLFTMGYLFSFIRLSFINLGFENEQLTQDHIRRICKAAPGNLYKVVLGQSEILKQTVTSGKKEATTLYDAGLAAGTFDAVTFIASSDKTANNLSKFLASGEY